MRTLVVLAVMTVVSTHQAYGFPSYGTPTYGGHVHGYEQPRYVGPLASSVPAGIGGKVIPVSDTYEVAAARDQFSRSYNDQLNTIHAIRASRPQGYGYGHGGNVHMSHNTGYSGPAVSHVSHAVHGTGHGVHANSGYSGPAVSHAVHGTAHGVHANSGYSGPAVSHAVHGPAVVTSHGSSYGAPSYGYNGVPTQVSDTPEVAAAKAEFFHLYNKQAAAAAAAPDVYTHNKHY